MRRRTALTALDLFCGGGGVWQGLTDAGFDEIVGVDNTPIHSKRYPGEFVHGCALEYLRDQPLDSFDFVWASPPCQRWSTGTNFHHRGDHHPDLLNPTRDLLKERAQCWVIENVPGSPLARDIILLGPMVGLPRINRRRYFEVSPWLRESLLMRWVQPPEVRAVGPDVVTITKSMSSTTHYYARKRRGLPGRIPVKEAREVMGIRHAMTSDEVGEAVAPPMAEYIGRLVIKALCGWGGADG